LRGARSCICVAIDDADLRRRVHRALDGVASELLDIDGLAESSARQSAGGDAVVTIVGSRVGGVDLTPAALHRLRATDPLIPIIVCLPPGHALQRRRSELALAGADRVITLDAPDEEADLRRDVKQALRHVLPPELDLGVDASKRTRGVAVELHCARNCYLNLTVQTLADRFDVGRGASLNAAKSEGWPDAESMIRVSRAPRSRGSRARGRSGYRDRKSLHFGTASAVYHHLKRSTRRTLGQLKFEGALKIAAE
jgi:hypothetical protein